tara:strand:- start:487 stop:840 length:354 start_codon:yes stop_codon:yes gene_type:complete
MPPEFFTELLDFGALGIFAGFLVWLYIGMQKRLDALVERFQDQLDKINTDYDERIDKMRERYDLVIREARDEASIEKELSQKLDIAIDKLDEGLSSMREQYKDMEIARRLREAKKSR